MPESTSSLFLSNCLLSLRICQKIKMRFAALTIAAYVALLQPVAANFDIYMVDVYDAIFKSHTRVRSIESLVAARNQILCMLEPNRLITIRRAGKSLRPSLGPVSTSRTPLSSTVNRMSARGTASAAKGAAATIRPQLTTSINWR